MEFTISHTIAIDVEQCVQDVLDDMEDAITEKIEVKYGIQGEDLENATNKVLREMYKELVKRATEYAEAYS